MAASDAAKTMMKIENTCPESTGLCGVAAPKRENATKLRAAAFRMSSIPIRMLTALRRLTMAMTPRLARAALTNR
jgi:hypothetical protein